MAKVLGIDLGTTNSVAAIIEAGEPMVVENAEGGRITPSVVALNTKTGERYVGQVAKRQAVTNPENTLFSVKRLMGRRFDEAEIQNAMAKLPYKIVAGPAGDAMVQLGEETHAPPQISSFVLAKIKQDAEAKLGEKISQAVITVPAYFNDAQRQATKDAGTIAGLEVLRIINEPTASSLAYGLDKTKTDATIAVFDLGGGTFDITILQMGDGVFEVKSTNGDTFLGGDDFDQLILEWMIDEFKQETGIDLAADRMALQRLRDAAERAKVELSSVLETEINLPFITADASGPQHMVKTLSRAKLDQLVSALVDRTEGPCRQALTDSGLNASAIDEVIMVGGMSRMPAVQEKVKQVFGKEPNRNVNPDEAVAMGAAIQAGVLAGEVDDIVLLDVTPLTLGLETLGSVMTTLISRNTTIPTKKNETFTTAAENQTTVDIHVLQGERSMASDNKSIGRFMLDGLLPAPRGIPQIEVTFDIDANGIVNVSAKDLGTGTEQSIKIESQTSLSEDEIKHKVADAEKFAKQDKLRRAGIDLLNSADSIVYQTKRMLEDAAEKVSDLDAEPVHSKLDELRALITKEDGETTIEVEDLDEAAVQAKIGEVEQEMHGISTKLYEAAAAEMAEQQDEEGDEDVVEADFEVVDSDEDE